MTGYVEDLRSILSELDLSGVTLVGHSVGGMISLLAALAVPDRVERLVLIGTSPRYLNDDDYTGGFTRADIDQLLGTIESNYLAWAEATAPAAMANPDQPELADELLHSFRKVDPEIALRFARATFLLDHRADLARVRLPTLVMQCKEDVLVPMSASDYLHQHIPGSELVILEGATGHFPHMSAPAATIAAIRQFVDGVAT
ncbi:alpha/beta fold hydrolase [Cryptosporangium sp. NPDC048952]|uniref:alpha/beta fold hydrolase n=1 Tax=Cryptosporangium sp. NPDC048952 TaxID=3363961 RepID=UPI0037128874